MHRIIPGLLALAWAAAGWAGNSNLQFGAPQPWVKPTQLPTAGADTQAAVKNLLLDYQVDLTPQTTRYYIESATHIQTPQGLTAAGTITIVWDPDTDVVTVHEIHILRGKQVIDVLGAGQTFTVARRETNLEYQALDDDLTAILQPVGLQVGDTIDVAYTLERTDPVLAGTLAAAVEIPPNLSVSRIHISARWPAAAPVKWRVTEGLTGVEQIHGDGTKGVTLTMSDLQPIVQPKDAPLRFLIDRRIEFSGLDSWNEVAQRFAPLFEHAARLQSGSLVQAQITSIRTATPDPKKRAALALALVENQIRYLALTMNDGGLVPADADQTWSRRYGDCKAKTALLLALLHGLDIEARPVAVSVTAGDGLDQHLPTLTAFDHVLVEATLGGQSYWLDGTRLGDSNLDLLEVPYFHWGLPLVPHSPGLVKMVPAPLTNPSAETAISIDASAGVAQPAALHAEVALHGYAAVLLKQGLGNLTPAQLDAGLRAQWSKQFSAEKVAVDSVAATYDDVSEVERMTMDGTVQMDWSDNEYAPPGLMMGYDADFDRQPGPHRDAPFAVAYPTYGTSTITIKLPLGGQGFSIKGADITRTVAGFEYRRRARIEGGLFTAVVTARSVQPEFPAAEAAADQKELQQLLKSTLEVDSPKGHVATEQEIAWGLPAYNSTADDYAGSGWRLWERREVDAAIADFDAALALDAHNALALGDRGLTSFWMGDYTHARADFDAALAAHPHSWVALNGRGLLAVRDGDLADAIAAFTEALRSNPKDTFVLPYLAQAYWRTGREDLAAADFAEAIRDNPSKIQLYWSRALLLGHRGKKAEAIRQARLVTAANPKSPLAYMIAGAIYLYFHESEDASAAFDRSVAVAPVAKTYLMRAAYRPWTDLAGKRADTESALKLDPNSVPALASLAELQLTVGEYREAVVTLTRAVKIEGGDARLFALRGIAYQKSGQSALAQRDLAKALKQSPEPDELNNLCWRLATAGVSLESALEDCESAVGRKPKEGAFQDSLGFVLLRLQRYAGAITAYDAALKLNSLDPNSLYGRGICELREGDVPEGDRDIKAAKALSYLVASEFAHYGVKP